VQLVRRANTDSILYPLVSDRALRSIASDSMKSSLGLLTTHCAQILKSRVSVNLGSIDVWSLLNANLSRNSTYSSFLQNPCKQVYDWQVRKSDHKGFIHDLRPLVHLGEVKAESYQLRGRGAYHFKITKLKSRSVPISSLSSLSCSCSNSSSSRYSSYQRPLATVNCRLVKHKASLMRSSAEQKKLLVVKAFLTIEQRSELERNSNDNRKRPAPDITSASSGIFASTLNNNGIQRQLHPQQAAKKPKATSASSEVIDLT